LSGSDFQTVGAATEKARLAKTVQVRRLMHRVDAISVASFCTLFCLPNLNFADFFKAWHA